MDVAATELECFETLQKQEQLASPHRINNLWTEVQKQKQLVKTWQNRYGSLIEELEKIQNIMDQYRAQAQQQEEIGANSHAHESTETTADETDGWGAESCEPVPHSVEHGSAIADDPSHDGTADQQVDTAQDQATSCLKNDMDVDSDKMQTTHNIDVKLPDVTTVAEDDIGKVEGTRTDVHINNGKTTIDMGAAVETSNFEGSKDQVMEAVNSH